MKALLVLSTMIVVFSLVTVYELILLQRLGIDILARLKVASTGAKNLRFQFEAVGVIAFILFQPLVLTWLVVWASNNINPKLIPIAAILPNILSSVGLIP